MTQEAEEAGKEVENLAEKLRDSHVDENASGDTIEITVVDEDGAVTTSQASAIETPLRRSSAEVLARVLESRAHLDLTGKVFLEPLAIKRKHGGAADVYEGTIIATEEKVAVKRLRLNIGGDEQIAKNIAREIRVWSEFNHINILPILGYCMEGDYPSLVSKWMIKGSLREYMSELDRKETMKMILGIAQGLAYIHSRNAIHSDLKSDNVLVSDGNQALLTDFGVSRMDALTAGYTTKSVKGNARWQAKEFFEIMDDDAPPPTHTVKTDIWAFGMTIYELLTHDVPYNNLKDLQVINYISHGKLPKKPEFSSKPIDRKIELYMWNICERCWNLEPEHRPSMAQLQQELEAFSSMI